MTVHSVEIETVGLWLASIFLTRKKGAQMSAFLC